MVPLKELVQIKQDTLQKSISHKDQKRVVNVLADMAGGLESPAYAILGMKEKLEKIESINKRMVI